MNKLVIVAFGLLATGVFGQTKALRKATQVKSTQLLSFRGFTPAMTFEAFKQGYGVRLETEKKELAKFDGYLDCNKITSGIQRCTDPTDGLTAEFVDDKLSELMWILKHDEFDVIREG